MSARRLASPVRPSVSDSCRLERSRRRFSRKSMPPRAPATSSAAVASSAAARCTVVNWPMTRTASAMAAKLAVSDSVRPATSSTRPARDARCHAAAAVSIAPEGPQRVDPRARDVGADGRLIAEGRVGDDVGELPEAQQQPRAVDAPAVQAEGHDDERELQDVAHRIGEVEGDVDRVALGDAGQRGEDERGTTAAAARPPTAPSSHCAGRMGRRRARSSTSRPA